MKNQEGIKGPLEFYIRWPLFAAIIPAALSVWLFFSHDREAGIISAAVCAVYLAVALILYFRNKNQVYQDMVSFAEEYASAQNQLFRNMAIPYALLLPSGKIIWSNEAFRDTTGYEIKSGLTIFHLFPELTRDQFPDRTVSRIEFHMGYRDRDYRIEMSRVVAGAEKEGKGKGNEFLAVYFYDETELNRYILENEEERLVTGLIYIDNFDEVMENVEEVRQSLLVALIDQKINQHMTAIDGIAKKMESDKYFVVFKQKFYAQLAAGHFSILEDVKTIDVGNEIAPTLSIGIGMHCATLSQNYEYARTAIDMALGRGGDQAVVKEKDHITYFGGKTQQTGKNTRVKARVKAEALREFILGKEQVLIMGHRMADIDAFGSAMGIYRIARTLGRHAHIVLDEVTSSVRPFLDIVKSDPEYENNIVVSSQEVLDMVDRNTILVVVDTNRPNYTQCPALLRAVRQVVVLDHHRRGEESIQNAVLSYVEPYASSASEMVAEIMQYVDDNIRIRHIEADCLLAGIMIDTNNFVTKAGVRTFEAAAYLRRCGADITRIRKEFRDDIDAYRAKAKTIQSAQIYRDHFAIARFPDVDIESPTIIGAQAANEMLNIRGVKAAFVLTPYREHIHISARSIDEVNVQLIMERLGGGGHMSTAGTQIAHTDMDEAVAALKQTLDEYEKEGN